SELVVELRTEAAASMRERLARALGDPTLDVAYRLGDGRYVDATGRPTELPRGAGRAVTAVTAGGAEVAVLIHDPAMLDEPALVESVRATAGRVLELARGIHPTLLRDEGLQAAVEALARRTPVPVTVEGAVPDRLPDPVEVAAYFVVSEALTNVVKHASATEASVLLVQEEGAL